MVCLEKFRWATLKTLLKDTSQTNQPKRVPLVITYNPALRSVSIIHKHLNILSASPRCANVFNATPLVAFRPSNNLGNLLVSAKLCNPNQSNQPRGSFRCGHNCLTCHYIADGLTSYTFYSTGEKSTMQSLSQTIHRRNQTTTQGHLQRTSQTCWQTN